MRGHTQTDRHTPEARGQACGQVDQGEDGGEASYAPASSVDTLRLCGRPQTLPVEAWGRVAMGSAGLLTGSSYIPECSRLEESQTLMTVSLGGRKSGHPPRCQEESPDSTTGPSARASGKSPPVHARREGGRTSLTPPEKAATPPRAPLSLAAAGDERFSVMAHKCCVQHVPAPSCLASAGLRRWSEG